MNQNQIDLMIMLIGQEGRHWYHLPIDEVEWTNPRYYHQN